MKTNELTGAALDWAVAKCEGMNERIVFGLGAVRDTGYCVERPNGTRLFYVLRNVWVRWFEKCETHPWGRSVGVWAPSTNWSQGGPIIEREKIGVWWATHVVDDEGTEYGNHWYAEPGMTDENADKSYTCMTGPTTLIAAMRCYVASKLGEEVDVPEELCK